jgi:UDP-glucuronate 4-epimerase
MIVLVTGAAGFIGSNVVDMLLARGDDVIGLDNFDGHYHPGIKRANVSAAMTNPRFELVEMDVSDADRLRALISARRPGGIVHLAARVSNRGSLSSPDRESYAMVNVEGTRRLLAACIGTAVRSFVHISTGNVYDTSAPAPFREGVTPELPRTPYACSKKDAETLVLAAASSNGLPAAVLRLFTVYGRRQRPDMVHFRFAEALRRGQPLDLIGAGSDLRDYIHVHDCSAAIMACLERPPVGEVINIGSGTGTRLDSLVALLARLVGKPPRIHSRKAPVNDSRLLLADIAKAKSLLEWCPVTGLESGLTDFVAWMAAAEKQ